MIDLVPLIDTIGENGAALAGGAVLGLVFGIAAQRSAFCTRSAVTGLFTSDRRAAAVWLAGFAAAIVAVQWLIGNGSVDVAETRFFSTAQSLSGALIGGGLFGLGMVLARGCVSRHLVLAAGGNIRALVTTLVIAGTGLATYSGFLVPARDAIGGLWNTAAIGGNDLLAHAGLGQGAGIAIGAALAIAALALAIAARASAWRILGGVAVGLAVAGGWYFTYTLSLQVFEPIQAESLSFIRPLATTGELATGAAEGFGLDQGVLIGTLAGAFLAAVAFGEFRLSGFRDTGAAAAWRYPAGGALMGFGGILAVGCTIGAGFTGGAVLAVSALAGLGAMVASAALAHRVIDVPAGAGRSAASAVAQPAE
ncbi:YeeE/YedE thiosulfate transporter family protein [Zhengella sp. ZM62]|uniref:YeeE/YedE thiosulfate transporter family protein n=1 Tax=Zhengella sedimenti TaxID=3390035 RepID=UPI00397651E7